MHAKYERLGGGDKEKQMNELSMKERLQPQT